MIITFIDDSNDNYIYNDSNDNIFKNDSNDNYIYK